MDCERGTICSSETKSQCTKRIISNISIVKEFHCIMGDSHIMQNSLLFHELISANKMPGILNVPQILQSSTDKKILSVLNC